MKFSLALFAAAAATIVSAQGSSSNGSLPACATSCANAGLKSTGCSEADIKCICSNSKFISSIAGCVTGKCSSDDVKATTVYAVSLCKSAGVTIPQSVIDSITPKSAASASSAAPSASAASSASSAASSTLPAAPTNGTALVSPSTPSASPSTGGTTTPTTGAASQFGVSALALGAAALAAFVL